MTVVPGQGYLSSAGGRNTKKDRPDAREVAEFHVNADTDGSPKALHHTLGPGPNQAAVGNHTHDAGASSGLTGYAAANHTHPLTIVWNTLVLSGGWTAYDAGVNWDIPGYSLENQRIFFRGLMKHATVTTVGTFATLPAGSRPNKTQTYNFACSGGMCRVDILNTGVMTISSYISPGTGAFISLSGVNFSIVP